MDIKSFGSLVEFLKWTPVITTYRNLLRCPYRCSQETTPAIISYTLVITKPDHPSGQSEVAESRNAFVFKANMNSDIQPETAAILLSKTGFWLGESHGWFHWMGLYSSCEEHGLNITKWKRFAHSGTRTHDPWIAKPLPLPNGHII